LDRVDLLGEGGENWTVGLAPHSVRAVHPHDLEAVVANRHGRVVHLHVSEQPAENAACLAATGKTPTGVLAEAGLLGPHLCAVHATHLTDDDIALLGASGSHVCFCPTTERDLADGIGAAKRLVGAGATLCVGSDSHAVIDLFEEARAIEQDERLITGVRGNHSPVSLLEAATGNGSTSLGWQRHGIAVGSPADFIALETNSVRLASFDPRRAAAHIVYSAAPADVRDVWVGGKQIVENFVHRSIDDVPASLRSAIAAVVTL
jgi:formiminoglutamate deiminase